MDFQAPTSKWIRVAAFFMLAVLFFVPRALNLVDYVTADEPLYLKQSAHFLYLLKEKQFNKTDLIVHPGVPSLWSGAIGLYLVYPEYLADERAEFPVADLNFRKILKTAGLNLNYLLAVSRMISVGLQACMILLAFYLGQQVFGFWPSFFITLLVSFDPFYFANSRILQPDGWLSTSMYLALVACLSYLNSRGWFALLVSGAATGLAVLSKVPGIVMLPLVAGLFLVSWRWGNSGQNQTRKQLLQFSKAFLIWLSVVFLVVFALWPVMWVEPIQAISKLASFAATASGEVNSPIFFNGHWLAEGEFGAEYNYYYPLSFMWRTTPVVMLGLVLGIISIFVKPKSSSFWKSHAFSGLAFLFSALLMIFFFTLSAKKFDRYILPAMVYLDVVSALGLLAFFSQIPWKSRISRQAGNILVMLVCIGFQIGMVGQAYPYYHSYYNPLLGGLEKAQNVMMVGWGEGLNEAGEYLNHRPTNTNYMKVFAWYSAMFDYHFVTVSQSIPISGKIDDDLWAEMLQADYVVTYISQRQRHSSQRLLDFLEDKPPEYVVKIRGVEVAWVYNMAEITDSGEGTER